MSNTTTPVALAVAPVPQTVLSTDLGTKNFQSDAVLAKNAAGFQIDDVIGYTKSSVSGNGTDPYNWYHWVQWTHSATPASGNVLATWVSYQGWDSAVANGTSNLNLQTLTTWTSATAQTTTKSQTTGAQDLGALGNVTAANVKASGTATTTAWSNLWTSNSWTAANSTTLARLNTAVYKIGFNGDPVIKVGQKVNYQAGYRWFATSTATVAVSADESATQTWTVVDNAVALAVSGVAAIVALTF